MILTCSTKGCNNLATVEVKHGVFLCGHCASGIGLFSRVRNSNESLERDVRYIQETIENIHRIERGGDNV